ncbi:murein DD-endopeptidase MepM/ murein hydrolase activator NlpD [Allocatelliglobosispora scoriae]|uniref:Murein DD-endopeptidase MepM/ murein hydrolase activator NlpD n=1 Tax=Allocatelliglobosispora scoriae TaxID=643052 RepID=A0A841BLI7_9ACTN|nr:peptidoglycan DD-metalloendopeptidase family protein [Allocatelliglobosispora scoriae]MBB5867843.1 murein DD-endopeptidase MepM/ murein hydrolase activator NlpD [Allocatelliglobosispora scoriae]
MDRRTLLLMTAAAVPAVILGSGRAALAGPGLPPLSIGVEPLEDGEAAYALLAPTVAGGPEQAKVVLRLALTNTGTTDLTVQNIVFVFPGHSQVVMQGVNLLMEVKDDNGVSDNGVLVPGQQKFWSNGTVEIFEGVTIKNQVYLPVPTPVAVVVQVYVTGYADPVQVALPLVPYEVSHRLPLHATDMRPGEMVTAVGDHWANGGVRGDQIYAHDIGVVAWDGAIWNGLLPGTNGTEVEHYRCWGLPIHAVAAGKAVIVIDGTPDNLKPGAFPKPTPKQVGGNQVWLQHPDGTMTWYTHMQQGSVTVAKGDTVEAGQVLGLLGTSGNSSAPHIHIEVRKASNGDSPLRPYQIADAWMIDQAANSPFNPDSPLWVPANGRAVPNSTMIIWPEASRPAWYPPNKDEIVQYAIPAASYQVVTDRLVKAGYRPVWIDAHEQDGSVFFNVIFHPADGVSWTAGHGMTSAQYQSAHDAAGKSGHRLINVTSYLQGGTVRYAAVFAKLAGPTMAAYHGLDGTAHTAQFNALAAAGYHPVNISIVSPDGNPQFTAFYHKEDVGGFIANSFTTAADYQTAWTANSKAGLHLTYLSACQHGGGFRLSAIWQKTAPGKGGTVGKHGISGAQLGTELDARQKAGLLTRAVAGWTDGKSVSFGAAWRG